jgi:hypothetical protein
MTFREDESRARERNVAENLSWLRRFALGLLKQHPNEKMSLVMKQGYRILIAAQVRV